MKKTHNNENLEEYLSRKHKHDKEEGSSQKHPRTQKLNRWPTKNLKATELLLPSDLRAILIGAPRSGL